MSLLVKTFNSRGLFKCRFVFSNLCSYLADFKALGDCYLSAFNENIKIGKNIDSKKINAKFQDGIMYITIPKKAQKIINRVIEID